MWRPTVLVACLLGVASPAGAQRIVPTLDPIIDSLELGEGPEVDCALEVGLAEESSLEDSPPRPTRRPAARPPGPPPVPEALRPPDLPIGRAIARLSESACVALLEGHNVLFQRLPDEDALGVGIPIRLDGELGGISVGTRNHSELNEIMDCRLAVALLAWAPRLRAAGVRRLVHYSTFRPGARVARSGRASGHASALALDLAVVERDDGSEVEVLAGWEARERGELPCEGDRDETAESAMLRRLVCGAAEDDLFQIVLTPHYDRAHANHVHLEVRPDVGWSFVR